MPFAWVSLDEQDNDPARLWIHIREALRQIAPEEAFGTDGSVRLDVDLGKHIETALPLLINSLPEFPQKMALVLDEYHCVKDSECHKLITFFVEHLPDTVHLNFSTRYDLPSSLEASRDFKTMEARIPGDAAFDPRAASNVFPAPVLGVRSFVLGLMLFYLYIALRGVVVDRSVKLGAEQQ